jgi:hypothetical protein
MAETEDKQKRKVFQVLDKNKQCYSHYQHASFLRRKNRRHKSLYAQVIVKIKSSTVEGRKL